MADVFQDGFDKYGPAGINKNISGASLSQSGTDLGVLLLQEWTSAISIGVSSFGATIVAPLSATGQAIRFNHTSGSGGGSGTLSKTLPGNYSRIIGLIHFASNLLNGSFFNGGWTFYDGASAQFSIRVNSTGTISLVSGDVGGTVIATSAASVSANAGNFLQFDVTIGAAGAYNIYLNGNGTPILTGTGNTRAGTGVSQVNVAAMRMVSAGTTSPDFTLTMDTFYLCDTSGSNNNSVAFLLNNPVIETQFPTSDHQTQFTNGAAVLGQSYSALSTTNAPGANQIALLSATPDVAMTLNSISIVPGASSAVAKFKAVLYAGITAGSAVIATGTEVVGCTSGTTLTLPFASGQSLTGGTSYAIGYITDTSIVLQQRDSTTLGSRAANTYASGSPATLPAMTTGIGTWRLWGNCTGATVNWVSEDDSPSSGDNSYAFSSTVGQEDLYAFPAISAQSVYTVAVKANMRRSDSGARTADLRMLSNATDSGGSATGITPPTSYTWEASYFPIDPNTGVAWTSSGLNASFAGPKVAS